MKSRLSFSAFAGLLVLLYLGGPAAGAPAGPPNGPPPTPPPEEPQGEETFYDTVDVNVVNVEVFVTDRDGRRVKGLTRDDFEIAEDGKPVEITNFYASEGDAVPAATVVGATGASAAPAAAEVPEEQRLMLAIFVDNSNLSARARNRVLPQIEDFLTTHLRPADRVVLASYSGMGSIEVRQEPSSDPRIVVASLERVARSAAGLQSGGSEELRNIVMSLELSPNPDSDNIDEFRAAQLEASSILDRIRVYASMERDKVRSMVATLGQFVDGLAGVPGRKAVLLVSGGTSLRPAQAIYDAWENRFGALNKDTNLGGSRLDGIDVDVTSELEKVGARANANRVTFYALGATDSLSVDSPANYNNEMWTRTQDTMQSTNMGQSLFTIVAPTGGMATLDTVNPGAVLSQLHDDMSSYYSLGYAPDHRRTGKNHKIEVRVKRPGLKVRHRESYRDRTSSEVMADKVMAALMFGARENPLEVGVELGEEARDPKGQNTVLITVKLPMSKLVLLPQGQFHEGKVSIFLAARGADGRTSAITEVKVPIRVPNEQLLTAMSQLAGYRTKMALRPAAQTVAIGVRDELGNIISTVTATYAPGQVPVAVPGGG
jgi:VWFA-related protein